MDAASATAALTDHLARIASYSQIAELLNWDQETQMPAKGARQRAEMAGTVAAALNALASDPRIPEWLAAPAPADDPAAAANRAQAARLHARASRIPESLAADLARTTAEAQTVWEKARAANRFADFAPWLERVLALTRAEAACLATDGTAPYDALLDDYEPGATAEGVAAVFDRLRPGLVALAERIHGRAQRPTPQLPGPFPAEHQLALARTLGSTFGYDWQAGRMDISAHPFCSGTRGDVRITTRIDEADPWNCLFSTLHEVGHAVYEQRLDPGLAPLPAGQAASMAVHESQSRLFENQLGRSRAFAGWLHAAMTAQFGTPPAADPDALWRAVNVVERGFIRTEADEVHYNLHIMMRFDLERALIGGDLQVAELEAAWNDRVEADFGLRVPDARRGVLQDVHWSAGLFGYFPTYALGNIYAAGLHAALCRDIPDLDARLAAGDLEPVLAWLGPRIHRRGRLVPPPVLVAEACGDAPTEAALLGYLEAKFGEVYGL